MSKQFRCQGRAALGRGLVEGRAAQHTTAEFQFQQPVAPEAEQRAGLGESVERAVGRRGSMCECGSISVILEISANRSRASRSASMMILDVSLVVAGFSRSTARPA